MDWSESINEGFPGPQPSEPAALRKDIADELTDHLACAMARELRETGDETEARRNVLARFGDPARIARKLWWDWMKETIMSQRVMMISAVVMAAACMAAAAFAWTALQQGRQMNQAMLAKLETLTSKPPAVSAAAELATLKVRLIEGSKQGNPVPVPGVTVNLLGCAFDSEGVQLQEKTNDDGVATFGPIRPNQYQVGVQTPTGFWHWARNIFLFAGSEKTELIVYPPAEIANPPETGISFQVPWPEDLEGKGLVIDFTCLPVPSAVESDGATWNATEYHAFVGPSDILPAILKSAPGGSVFALPKRRKGDNRVLWSAGKYEFTRFTVYRPVGKKGYCTISAQNEYPAESRPTFEAHADRANEWKIELPEELVENVRAALAKR